MGRKLVSEMTPQEAKRNREYMREAKRLSRLLGGSKDLPSKKSRAAYFREYRKKRKETRLSSQKHEKRIK